MTTDTIYYLSQGKQRYNKEIYKNLQKYYKTFKQFFFQIYSTNRQTY